jgi:hypothetical protein
MRSDKAHAILLPTRLSRSEILFDECCFKDVVNLFLPLVIQVKTLDNKKKKLKIECRTEPPARFAVLETPHCSNFAAFSLFIAKT